MTLGAFLMLVGIAVVWFGGPTHGVNGTTILGVILFVIGFAVRLRRNEDHPD